MIDFQAFVDDFAIGLVAADAERPIAVNRKSGQPFQPGIGPHGETQAIKLILEKMQASHPAKYGHVEFEVPYPDKSLRKCDLSITHNGNSLFTECKIFRMLGDNGKQDNNRLKYILSPYPKHYSALTDCEKLRQSGFAGRKAVLIFGYENGVWPLRPVVDAFEIIVIHQGNIGQRYSATYTGLCHPIHISGEVFIWEVF